MTINAANLGVAQSIIPAGTSAPLPAITSLRSPVRAVDPLSVTSGMSTPASSTAAASSPAAATTATSASSARLAIPNTAVPSSAAATTSRAAITARNIAQQRDGALQKRSDIPINGTIGIGQANIAYPWAGSLPEGNYLISFNIPDLGLSASQQVTVVEPDSGDLSCLSPWRALSAQLDEVSTSGTSRSTVSARPSGSLAESSSDNSSSGASGGMIAGIVVGVVGGLAILGLLAFCCFRRRRQRRDQVYNDFDYHKNERDRVNLDDFRGEKLGSAGGSPEQVWGPGVGTSSTSSRGHHFGRGVGNDTVEYRGDLEGVIPVPLGRIPRSERGSIDSISAKSLTVEGAADDVARTGGGSSDSASHNAYPPSTLPQLPQAAAIVTRPDPFSHSQSHSGSATPRTPTRLQRFDDGRRQSSPPISPSGYTSATSHFGIGAGADFNPEAINAAFANRSVGDRSSGVASDALAGRRPSAPGAIGPGQGLPGGVQGQDPVQRKGSVKRKPVPSLGPALRKELSEGPKSRQGSVSSTAGGVAGGQFGKMESMLAQQNQGDKKEYVIMPDPPRSH